MKPAFGDDQFEIQLRTQCLLGTGSALDHRRQARRPHPGQ